MTNYKNLLIVSIIGFSIGVLIVFDPYGTFFIGDKIGIKLLPYTFSLVVFTVVCLLGASLMLLVKYFPAFLSNKELLFVPMFLIGYQMNSLSLAVLDPGDFAIGLFMFFFIISILVTEKSTLVITPMLLMSLLMLGLIFIPIIYTTLPQRTQFQFVKTFCMYILLINFLNSKELFLKAIRWLIIITSCYAALGIFQELFYWATEISLVGNIPTAQLKRMYEPTSFGYLLRVPGLMMSYRSFALTLAVVLVMTISLILFPKAEIFKKRRYLYINAILLFFALLFTFSNDILLGLFLAMGIMFILWRPSLLFHFITVSLLVVVLLLTIFAYLPGKMDNFNYILKDIPKSEHERLQLNREGIERYINGPFKIFGRGADRGYRYTGHVLEWPAHNAFILIADEIGIFAFLLYAAMFLYSFFRLLVLNVKINDPFYRPIAMSLLCGLIVHIVGAQFTANYVEPFLWFHFGLIEVLWILVKDKPFVPVVA